VDKSEWVSYHDDIKHHEDGIEGVNEEVQSRQSVNICNRTVEQCKKSVI